MRQGWELAFVTSGVESADKERDAIFITRYPFQISENTIIIIFLNHLKNGLPLLIVKKPLLVAFARKNYHLPFISKTSI